MAKKAFIFIISSSIITVLLAGCYNDKADMAYPKAPVCDTTNVTLSVDLTDIMTANCFRCHSGAADLGAGIALDDYLILKDYADNGLLLSSINQDGTTSSMPKGAAKLSKCDIDKFDAWVKRGAQQN